MKKRILGLDLGTNSIGWALIQHNFETKEGEILGMGSRIIPMGTDKQDYEKGDGVTKNATRREKRSARKMNKRYKLRRNKLLYILHELEMLPEQFKFKDGIPDALKIQGLELLPIEKGTLQLTAKDHFQLKVNALNHPLDDIRDFGKILYGYNQLRGYSGGNSDEDDKETKKKDDDDNEKEKNYETITQVVEILSVEKLKDTFKYKNETLNKYSVTVVLDDEEIEGWTKLQNLEEKIGAEEELRITIKRLKNKTITYEFALPQKTNWRKQMEKTEETLKKNNLFVSELLLKDLEENKWTKVRNRVILRSRYQTEFDEIWDVQAKKYPFLNDCPKDKLEKIAHYIFPGQSESQSQLRNEAMQGGLKHIIRNQIIYYQRPLKPQTDLIGKCQFEKEEKVIPTSHPLFQEFRCWDQINRIYITSKQKVYNEKKRKDVFQYTDRFLTEAEKKEIYSKLQFQKEIGFNEVSKIVNLKKDNTEFLNGLNVKAKLKGCDTLIGIRKYLGEHYELLVKKDINICNKIWKAVFENNNGNEYDPKSKRVSSITELLTPFIDNDLSEKLALSIAQNVKYPRKYASLSRKAIENILPLMQLNPAEISEKAKSTFEETKHLIETGEIFNENPPEDYIISFVKNNPDALQKGGLMYAFASSLVYKKHTKETIKQQIFNYHDIKYIERNLRNSVVEQILNEVMQVIKAIWKKYKIDPNELEIRVELARDLKNSKDERSKIFKAQGKNKKINDTIRKRLIELKQEPIQKNIDLYKLWSQQSIEDYPKQSKEPTEEEIEKLRIWEEQKCISPYTLKPIPLSKLFSSERLYDIDHIVPKSRYFDDSLTNKIVCESSINEEKANRTAWEYISQQNSRIGICSTENYVQYP